MDLKGSGRGWAGWGKKWCNYILLQLKFLKKVKPRVISNEHHACESSESYFWNEYNMYF